MNISVFKYFVSYIISAKTRQKLLLLSVCGLGLSSFSLTVLQGVMGGLQNGLITRSKNINGHGHIRLSSSLQLDDYKKIEKVLTNNKIQFVKRIQEELLIQNKNQIFPIKINALDFSHRVPHFLNKVDHDELVLGSDIGFSLNTFIGDDVTILSPSSFDFVFVELPRQAKIDVSDFLTTNIPEVDSFEGWVRLSFLQNLLRTRKLTDYMIIDEKSFLKLKQLSFENYKDQISIVSWEEQNNTLVWALGLETKVMFLLFSCMCILLGICIISGNLIFYNQVKRDLACFWVLGLSKNKIMSLVKWFGQFLSILFSVSGVVVGLALLYLIDSSALIVLPDYFVERNIPVNINYFEILKAVAIPYFIAGLFTWFTFRVFQSEKMSFLSFIQKN